VDEGVGQGDLAPDQDEQKAPETQGSDFREWPKLSEILYGEPEEFYPYARIEVAG